MPHHSSRKGTPGVFWISFESFRVLIPGHKMLASKPEILRNNPLQSSPRGHGLSLSILCWRYHRASICDKMAAIYGLKSEDTLAKFRSVIDPRDHYVRLCSVSFPLATEYSRMGESRIKDQYREGPSQLSIQEVQDSAKRGDVDGILELGMRCVDQSCGSDRSLLCSFAARPFWARYTWQ
jgi:hypothetical protein